MIKTFVVSLIHSFATLNISRAGDMFKDKKDLESLAGEIGGGYDPAKGLIKIRAMSDAEIEQAVTERKTYLQKLVEATDGYTVNVRGADQPVTVAASDVLRAFQEVYCDKKGEVVTPKYAVVAGHRRSNALLLASAARRVAGFKDPDGNSYFKELPYDLREYGSTLAWQLDCLSENMLANVGRRQLSDADRISAAVLLYQSGGKEADLQHKAGFSRQQAQKLFAFARCETMWPAEKLKDRALSGEIVFSALDKEKLRGIANMGDTPEAVETLRAYVGAPRAVANKVASGKEIGRFAEQSPLLPVKAVLSSVLANDLGRVNELLPFKDEINEWWTATIVPKLAASSPLLNKPATPAS